MNKFLQTKYIPFKSIWLNYKALFLHVGHVVIHVEKAGDKRGIKGDLPTEDVLQVVQLFLHAVDVQVEVLLADLPGETECVK